MSRPAPGPVELSRRSFLTASAAAAALAACTKGSGVARTKSGDGWDAVRDEFVLSSDAVNLTTFVLASHPRAVRDAIARHREGLDADPLHYLEEEGPRLDTAVLDALASYLDTDPRQVALTDSTTMSLGLLYGGLRLEPGDEILTTEHDFYSTHESLRLRELRDGVVERRVRLYDDPNDVTPEQIQGVITHTVAGSPRIRAVAITWVHSVTGMKLPVRLIADGLAKINEGRSEDTRVLLCVDGVHGFGVEDDTPAELGCDFLAAGTHKWLFGPRGTGFLWGTPQAWHRMHPTIPTFARDGIFGWIARESARDQPSDASAPPPPEIPPGAFNTPGGFHSFEHRWALADALEWRMEIGPERVRVRTHELALSLKEGLGDAGLRVATPTSRDLSSGLVCTIVDGQDPYALVGRLAAEHGIVASVTPYAESFLRFGPSVLNSEDDVDRAVAATAALAG